MDMNLAMTRFPLGVTNVASDSPMANMGQLDPTTFHTFFDDFDSYVVQDGSTSPLVQWTETLNSGTIAKTAVNGGALLFTLANSDEAITQLQRTTATYLLTVGKKTFFKARLKTANIVLTDIFLGLANIDTTLIAASALACEDAIGFFKAATATEYSFYCRTDSTTGSTSSTGAGTPTLDVYHTVEFYYDGVDKAYFGFNGAWLGSVSAAAAYLPNAQLSPSIAFGQEGTGGAGTGTVDYIFSAQER